jgi:Zn2+/Cd2+-exporting ATPase
MSPPLITSPAFGGRGRRVAPGEGGASGGVLVAAPSPASLRSATSPALRAGEVYPRPPVRTFSARRVGLLASAERLLLGLRLTLAMLAAGLLAASVSWRLLLPDEADRAELLAGGAAILVAGPVLSAAWHSLRQPSLHGLTDRLIALAMIAAWAGGDLLTAAVLPIIMILGHVLEERSLLGSREAIRALTRLAQTTARRLSDDGVEVVPTDRLRAGDRIEVRAGDRLPVDGTVLAGTANLDIASLTGESLPVDVAPGAPVLAGSISTDGRLEIEVTRVGAETTLGRIIALMRTAERVKPPVSRLLEKYAGQYLTVVLMLAGGTWFATGDTAATLAVLVASCPCALVLAAPATSIAAIAVAARHGILIKGAAFLENLAEVTSVILDKTGTVTTGALCLVATSPPDDHHLLALAASLGATSNHPVSRAAAAACADRVVVGDVREAGGAGLIGTLNGEILRFGRPELFESFGVAAPDHDGPIAGVSQGDQFLGWLLFADPLRPGARAALAGLRDLGLTKQVLLTGDRARVAVRIGRELDVPEIVAEAFPEQKLRRVQQDVRRGERPLVVGDGINDSLALKAGAVGIAMGARGSDVALASADIVLMGDDLGRIPTAIRLSRRCRRTIHVNVALGLGWTLTLIALAAAGILGSEGAIVAALLHNLSTLLGMVNAGRILLFDETDGTKTSRE